MITAASAEAAVFTEFSMPSVAGEQRRRAKPALSISAFKAGKVLSKAMTRGGAGFSLQKFKKTLYFFGKV